MPNETIPPSFKPWRAPKAKATERQQNRARWRISPRKRGYDSRWDKASMGFRRSHPWCEFCRQERAEDLWEPTAVTDHMLPAHEFPALRFVRSNWVPLCAYHHDSAKAKLEAFARKHGCLERLVEWCKDPMSRPAQLRPLSIVIGYQWSLGS